MLVSNATLVIASSVHFSSFLLTNRIGNIGWRGYSTHTIILTINSFSDLSSTHNHSCSSFTTALSLFSIFLRRDGKQVCNAVHDGSFHLELYLFYNDRNCSLLSKISMLLRRHRWCYGRLSKIVHLLLVFSRMARLYNSGAHAYYKAYTAGYYL